MAEITKKQVIETAIALNKASEDTSGMLLVDALDDVLYDAIIKMGGMLGYNVLPKDDITNPYLMELRNEIIDNLADNFVLEQAQSKNE